MYTIPSTYAMWVPILEAFKKKENDSDILKVMKSGTLVWQSGTAERFTKRFCDAVNARINAVSDKFTKEQKHGVNAEQTFIMSVNMVRTELRFLKEAADIPAIPAETKKNIIDMIQKSADSFQESLENSAKSDRTGKLESLIRNNRINVL